MRRNRTSLTKRRGKQMLRSSLCTWHAVRYIVVIQWSSCSQSSIKDIVWYVWVVRYVIRPNKTMWGSCQIQSLWIHSCLLALENSAFSQWGMHPWIGIKGYLPLCSYILYYLWAIWSGDACYITLEWFVLTFYLFVMNKQLLFQSTWCMQPFSISRINDLFQ